VDARIRSHDLGLGTAEPHPAEPMISLDPSHGLVQGLASILIAMTFIIGSPGVMHVMWVVWDSHFRDFTKTEIVLVAICGFGGGLIIITSAIFGLVFGISAIVAARRGNRPAALGVAGVLLNGFCVLLWLFIGVLWAFAVGSRI
jgi:hypothetical protein